MITARLLLIPVLSSVELKAWAEAERVLSVKIAAAMRSEGSRVRTLGLMYLVNFIRVCFFRFRLSGITAEHAMTISQARKVLVYGLHNIHVQSGLHVRDEQNDRLD